MATRSGAEAPDLAGLSRRDTEEVDRPRGRNIPRSEPVLLELQSKVDVLTVGGCEPRIEKFPPHGAAPN